MLKIDAPVLSASSTKQKIVNNLKKKIKKNLTTSDNHVIILITTRGIPWKRK